MSDDLDRKLTEEKERLKAKAIEEIAKVKRSLGSRIGRVIALIVLAFLLLIGALAWYTTTPDFDRRVNHEVVQVLEDATGGRVELQKLTFNLWHLAIEADGLVIHGLEGPVEAPYLSADKIQLRIKLFNFFSHIAGSGASSHVSLNYLSVDHPQMHLIIDKNGKTNQPTPKHPSTSTPPVTDTLLDLKAKEVLVNNGVALLNDKAIPFDLAAHDLNAEIHYIPSSDRYGATIDLQDLRTKMAKQVEAQSTLHLTGEIGRDIAELKSLDFTTGKSSNLQITGTLQHFANPEWQATAKGTLEIKQVSVLTNVEGLEAGTVDLDINAHNCITAPPPPPKRPGLFGQSRSKTNKQSVAPVSPNPDCVQGYLVTGNAKVHKAAYRAPNVRLHDIDGRATVRITPAELLLTSMIGYLPGGGYASGDMRIADWLSTTTPSRTYLDAKVNKIPLRTIMDVTASDTGDLGFDTAVTGPVKVTWGGPAKNVADTVEVDGDLTFTPTGTKRRGALNDVPVSGQTVARYIGKNETVIIQHIELQTPGTNLEASGILGVSNGDPLTMLRTDLTIRDLGEFDQLLTTLDLESNGKRGRAAIPLTLHGGLQFNGTARGSIADLDVKGHVQAQSIEAQFGTTNIQVDSLLADAEYSPDEGILVVSSTIHRGTAVLNVAGKLVPHKVLSRRGVPSFLWDNAMTVDASVQLANTQVVDLLQIAGQQQKVPVTGTISLNAHAAGTISSLNGGGHVSLSNGTAYGEPYESAVAELTVHGKDIEASSLTLKLHGMQIAGNGGYDMDSERLHGHIAAHDISLSKFVTLQQSNSALNGVADIVADANGTITEPGVKASLRLSGVTYEGQPIGDATADVHSQGSTLYISANSTMVGAKIDATGQLQLTGDYPLQAKLNFTGLDIGKPMAMFGTGTVKAQSLINGTATVTGPLKAPKTLSGNAELSQVDVKLQGIELKAAEPLRVSLHNGIATLEQVHITGQDTDMRASGTAQLLGVTDPKGGKLDVKATGTVSTTLLHTFDSDITSTGKIEFTIAAGGRVPNPELTGKVQFDNVNASMEGIPNGLSNMNGTLVFNGDRLQVQSLTAQTGGGIMKIGGDVRFKNGVYAELTATGDNVRVRLYGLSTTANANLKLEGNPQAMQLSGNILITRFGIGPDVDFAAFSSSTGGISAAPDPNSAANRIRLNVHITSAPQLDFQNSYAKLAGTVDLTIRGTAAVPSILGRIEINDGSATFAGTKYQLQRGDIYFTNPVRIDPTIDLDVTAQVENYDVTVGLHGTSTSLKPTYRSEPPLSEADIFALLALGRTQEEAQLYQERQTQQGTDPTTSALLGGALNATVSNRVEKLFGVGSVKIDPAFVGTLGDSSARITVQQQISRQITATFATNVNTSAQQLIQVQYDFNHNNSLVVTRDESGVYSVVYKLRRRYR